MKIRCQFGTPGELETHEYTSAAPAKNYISKKMRERSKWAQRFNHALERRLVSLRWEVDQLDLATVPAGDKRRWEATDDVTGVTFVWTVEVMSK